MNDFANLFAVLDATTRTNEKVSALADYFKKAGDADAAWTLYFLSGRKLPQRVPVRKLAAYACEAAGIEDWLFEACYDRVGDLAETIALLLPAAAGHSEGSLADWVQSKLLPLKDLENEPQREAVLGAWKSLSALERYVFNKLITGGFRVGVSQTLVVRGLAQALGRDPQSLAHKLMGHWQPTAEFFAMLRQDSPDDDRSRPYPFCLAHPLEGMPADLGPLCEWQAEWKWDGIRAQLVRRGGETHLWTRGEELVTDRYPELLDAAAKLADGTVLDGEILPMKGGKPLPFTELQKRIGRKTVSKKLLAEVPVVFLAYDAIECERRDIREEPLSERRRMLEGIVKSVANDRLLLSDLVTATDWPELAALRAMSRSRGVEGLMLKRLRGAYKPGRTKGEWWKWKVEPYAVDAVLVAAQPGHGKRGGLFTDYTFAVRHEGKLITFAKAYSGLTDAEIREVDAFVRANVIEKFGPVRTVKPELVFEIGFENLQRSSRHKSGVAVRFPRMLRWRKDKTPDDADALETILAMLDAAS